MVTETQMDTFKSDLISMANLVKNSIQDAMDAFVNNDKVLALKVMERDELINHSERLINSFAIDTMLLQQPVARDLRLLIGGIKIATDLERIGDYAKNICRYVIRLEHKHSDASRILLDVIQIFLTNFEVIIECMESMNVKSAYEAVELDSNLDIAFAKILTQYDDDPNFKNILDITMINLLRNIERAGDHGKNICEHIIYIVKGTMIDFG